MIKLLIFDFDGVIEDTYEKHFQLSEKQVENLTREEHRKLFEGNIHEMREKLKSEGRHTGFDVKTPFDEHKPALKIKKEIKEGLIDLSKKYKLGIITSSKEGGLKKYLENNRVENLFGFVYGFQTHKSKIEKFKLILKNFNLKSSEIIFVTDTLGDILEANDLGIKTIAVDFGYHERKRLEKGKPLIILSSFKEVKKYINNL